MARVSAAPPPAGHERHESLFQEQRRGRRAGEGLHVRVEAAATARPCHDTLWRTAGALWLACGSSAVRTRRRVPRRRRRRVVGLAAQPGVLARALHQEGAPKPPARSPARAGPGAGPFRASATASFAISSAARRSAGTAASASWCNSGTRRSGWCTVSLALPAVVSRTAPASSGPWASPSRPSSASESRGAARSRCRGTAGAPRWRVVQRRGALVPQRVAERACARGALRRASSPEPPAGPRDPGPPQRQPALHRARGQGLRARLLRGARRVRREGAARAAADPGALPPGERVRARPPARREVVARFALAARRPQQATLARAERALARPRAPQLQRAFSFSPLGDPGGGGDAPRRSSPRRGCGW